jgi:hypothetical protein
MRRIALRARFAFFLTLLAVIYSLGLLLDLGFGPGLVSLVISLIVWIALYRRCSSGTHLATFVSSTLAGLFLAYSVVGLFSIAPFYFPAAAALLAAVLLTPEGRSPRASSP